MVDGLAESGENNLATRRPGQKTNPVDKVERRNRTGPRHANRKLYSGLTGPLGRLETFRTISHKSGSALLVDRPADNRVQRAEQDSMAADKEAAIAGRKIIIGRIGG